MERFDWFCLSIDGVVLRRSRAISSFHLRLVLSVAVWGIMACCLPLSCLLDCGLQSATVL